VSLARLRAWCGPLATWVVDAPVGTVRYRFCLAVLLGRRAPTLRSRAHLTGAAFLAPVRDRLPRAASRSRRVRLREPPYDVTWTVGPASDFDVLNEVLVLGEYDDLALSSPAVIVDLGSHIGASILRLRAAYPQARIYGFEPDPATFARLVPNVAQLPDVVVRPWAISERDGPATFYQRGQSWISSMSPHGSGRSPITVESVTLDSALARLGVDQVDLLKIDVEGAEPAILRRFRGLSGVSAIVGELHGEPACSEVLGVLTGWQVETRGHPDHCHLRARRA
jgi:FkbM family methyltransferase